MSKREKGVGMKAERKKRMGEGGGGSQREAGEGEREGGKVVSVLLQEASGT